MTIWKRLAHAEDKNSALFRPLKNNITHTLRKHLHPTSLYDMVLEYAEKVGLKAQIEGRWVHLARAIAITNALENEDRLESDLLPGFSCNNPMIYKMILETLSNDFTYPNWNSVPNKAT
jgi:hypothetical protein